MNKITLQDIMESLNSDDMESARASLHEWFVDQSKQIHSNMTNPVMEDEDEESEDTEEVNEADEEDEEDEEDDTLEESILEEGAEDEEALKQAFPGAMKFAPIASQAFYSGGKIKDGVKSVGDLKAYKDGDTVYYRKWIGETVEVDIAESEEDLIAELAESFAGLETVSDKLQNQEGAQVGEEGKVPVNTKSTLPNHKAKDRMGGEAVEIKNDQHNGFALEKAPKAKDAPVKHHVQNSKDDLKKVDPKGDKSAMLNKKDGFGSDNAPSPISGKGAKGLKK